MTRAKIMSSTAGYEDVVASTDRSSQDDDATTTDSEELANSFGPLESRHPVPMNRKRKAKLVRRILRLRQKQHEPENSKDSPLKSLDADSLFRQAAICHGGLVRDEYRREIWPNLAFNSDKNRLTDQNETNSGEFPPFSLDSGESSSAPGTPGSEMGVEELPYINDIDVQDSELCEHAEWHQVEMDVYRTLARFPPGISEKQREIVQSQVIPLTVKILFQNPAFRYYQGFHDVCLTLQLVLGQKDAYRVGLKLATDGIFRRFLTEPLDNTMQTLELVYVILRQTDPELESFLRRANLGTLFGLSWLITWFSHSIDSYEQVTRLFDLFLASHQLMPIYFAAALILFRGADIMRDCECDMPPIHAFLSKIPDNLPMEALISDAQDLFVAYPPSKLQSSLQDEYKIQVRQEELVLSRYKGGRHPGLIQNLQNRGTFSVTFWAVTASAAAWYFYSHSQTVMELLG